MREIIKKIYSFCELSEKAKQFAINKYRDSDSIYTDFDINKDFIIDDFISSVKEKYCFEIDYQNISFSGFWSQGDGASFTHEFTLDELSKLIDLLGVKIKHGLKQFYLENLYSFKIKRINYHYSHMYAVDTEIISNDLSCYNCFSRIDDYFNELDELITEKIETLKDRLCNELYEQLEKEYEYLTSDEYIKETLSDDCYEFYENGKMYFE